MIIYKDLVSNDELFSDAYKMRVVDDVFYEVEGKMTTEGRGISEDLIGGNPSTEEAAEAVADESVSGVDIILANRLVETSFAKKEYQTYLKDYMKKVVAHLEQNRPERVADFKKNTQLAVKKVFENFKDWQFFMGESCNVEGMIALLNYREDGVTPYMLFFRDGLIEEKQ